MAPTFARAPAPVAAPAAPAAPAAEDYDPLAIFLGDGDDCAAAPVRKRKRIDPEKAPLEDVERELDAFDELDSAAEDALAAKEEAIDTLNALLDTYRELAANSGGGNDDDNDSELPPQLRDAAQVAEP